MVNIFKILEVELRVDFSPPDPPDEGEAMPWPSLPDKIVRSALVRLGTISVANGFQTDIIATNIITKVQSLEWAMDHAPCLMVWLGDEDPKDEFVGGVEKSLDVFIWGMTMNKDDPQTAREKLIEDIKDALYAPNRLENPDGAGFLGNGLEGLKVERDEGELAETGHAAFRLTAPYLITEAIQRASL